jgi:hypothetical protein
MKRRTGQPNVKIIKKNNDGSWRAKISKNMKKKHNDKI